MHSDRRAGPTNAAGDVVRRELVETKLVDFYREYAPEKIHGVHTLYEAYSGDLLGLFSAILQRYPEAPRESFNDVVEALRFASNDPGRDGSPGERRYTPVALSRVHPDSERRSHPQRPDGTVAALLDSGRVMLQASPRPAESAHSLAIGGEMGHGGGSANTHDRIAGPPHAIDRGSSGNATLDLAKRVADAEVAAQQERFRVLAEKLLRDAGDNVPIPELRVQVAPCSQQQLEEQQPHLLTSPPGLLHVPCTHAMWVYLFTGVLRCPLPPAGGVCCSLTCVRIGGGGAAIEHQGLTTEDHRGPYMVDAHLLASAMRVWSRYQRHTVTEALSSGKTRAFHSCAWWLAWPQQVSRVAARPSRSLFTSASNGTDGTISSAVRLRAEKQPGSLSVLDSVVAPRPGATVSRADEGYWCSLAHAWDAVALRGEQSQHPR